MIWLDRAGNPVPGDEGQDRLLAWMYGTGLGRMLVGIMIRPWVSRLAGRIMDSRISALAVKPFCRKNDIDLGDFEQRRYTSFNDFFTRRIRPGARPMEADPNRLIAPCDSKLTVYPVTPDSHFRVKGVDYTLPQLLRDETLAEQFLGGTLLLFRLTVGDYHRYSCIDSGTLGRPVHIPGVYHTVNPAAAEKYPIYRENTREYTLLESTHFGTVLQMEVGAAMVGRIVNHPGLTKVERGQEKGYFAFGGSTVIVLLQRGRAEIDADLLENTRRDAETVVRLGMGIGRRTE